MREMSRKTWQSELSDVADLIQYGYTAKSSAVTKGPKYLRITDIQNDHVNWVSVPHVLIHKDDFEKYRLKAGDIVFARSGATVGKSFLIRDDPGDAVFASYLIRVRCTPGKLDPEYASFFFGSENYWQQIKEGASGTGQPNFNGTKLGALCVPMCSIEDQRFIVRELHDSLTHSRAAREELRKAVILLDRLDQALFGKAFPGDLSALVDADPKNINVVAR